MAKSNHPSMRIKTDPTMTPKMTPPTPPTKSATKAHPGFGAVSARIAKTEGVSPKAADAILAASSRNASAKAKAKNPRLKRVK